MQIPEVNCTLEPVIQVSNISKTFGRVKALDDVSLTIYKNEIFGLLGPNGSGKTTLLRILATLLPPDSRRRHPSHCKITGLDVIRDQGKVRQNIGYVPQQDALYSDLSAYDNLVFFGTPYASNGKKERIDELLRMVGLYDRRHSLVKTFSGGMLKRLSIICSLVHEPPVILMDEATVGLDVETRHEIWDLARKLKHKVTIIVTTHYTPDAEEHCDRVAWVYQGHILDIGTPADLIKNNQPARNLDEAMSIAQKRKEEETASEEIQASPNSLAISPQGTVNESETYLGCH